MSAPADIQAETLARFLNAWKKWSAEDWLNIFADDITQVTMPFALGIPSRSRAEVEQTLPALVAAVQSYELTIHNVIHDVQAGKAAVYALSKGKLPWGPWELEYAVFITFNKAGDKIACLEEMLDSAFLKDFGPKFGQYLQQLSNNFKTVS
ncbi:hypothetical protein EV356DRAFT_517001 [Viridothelium virens]|uniref:SnoaL-like domain-containing protein n=1 Tax=Viridothelium virens TaxID=1048519 RepID=A0A6A6H4W9_VIRVR|nr:hypothetical protein EV356DRAFT_517001 [Viridothelium virens]